MKTKSLLILLTVACIMFLASCKKDETPEPLSSADAKTAFTQAEVDYTAIITGIENEKGPSVQSAFNNYGFPTIPVKKSSAWTERSKQNQLNYNLTAFAKVEDNQYPFINFNFDEYVGTWTYTTVGGWEKTATNPTDKVVLVIPYGEGGTATLTYSDHLTKTIGIVIYTSQLKGELRVSTQSTPVMSWVYNASRNNTNYSNRFIFSFGDYSKTDTYSTDGQVTKSLTEKVTTNSSTVWEKSGEIIYAKSFSIISTHNEDQTYTTFIDGKLRVKGFVIDCYIHYDQTTDLSNPSKYIAISVWTTDAAKVANIIFKADVDSEYQMYIKFNDGTEELLKNYLDNLSADIETFRLLIR